jgi:hypothetical protein
MPDDVSDRTKQQYSVREKVQKTQTHLTQNEAMQTWNSNYSDYAISKTS